MVTRRWGTAGSLTVTERRLASSWAALAVGAREKVGRSLRPRPSVQAWGRGRGKEKKEVSRNILERSPSLESRRARIWTLVFWNCRKRNWS